MIEWPFIYVPQYFLPYSSNPIQPPFPITNCREFSKQTSGIGILLTGLFHRNVQCLFFSICHSKKEGKKKRRRKEEKCFTFIYAKQLNGSESYGIGPLLSLATLSWPKCNQTKLVCGQVVLHSWPQGLVEGFALHMAGWRSIFGGNI